MTRYFENEGGWEERFGDRVFQWTTKNVSYLEDMES